MLIPLASFPIAIKSLFARVHDMHFTQLLSLPIMPARTQSCKSFPTHFRLFFDENWENRRTAKPPVSNPADCGEVKLSLSVFVQNMKND
jgi:hypothetical protein